MKSAAAGLVTHLGQKDRTLAICFKITRVDGSPQEILGFTSHNEDLVLDADGEGSLTYAANTVLIEHGATPAGEEMSVDNMGMDGVLKSGAITEADIRAGRYDSADVKVFLVNWNDTNQVLKLLSGQIGTIDLQDNRFRTQLLSLKYVYQELIVDLMTPRCNVELGGTKCGIILAPAAWAASTAYSVGDVRAPTMPNGYRYTVIQAGTSGASEPTFSTTIGGLTDDPDGSPTSVVWETLNGYVKPVTIGVVTSRKVFEVNGATDAEGSGGSPVTLGWAESGLITVTSGDNKGVSREIAVWTEDASPQTHSVDLHLPMPFDLNPGDTANVTIACDKILSTCRDRFGNVANFRGFPYLPGRDEVFRRKTIR